MDIQVSEVHNGATTYSAPRPVEGVGKVLAALADMAATDGELRFSATMRITGITFHLQGESDES